MSAALIDPAQHWQGDLEEVEECPVCGDTHRRSELRDVRDTTFAAAGGTWNLQRCAGCTAAYLDPRPSPHSIHLAYRNYYTHAAAQPTHRSVRSTLQHALANGYRNRIFRTKLKPALAMGALLAPCFPALAQHIREEDRGIGTCDGSPMRVLDVGCGNGHFLQVARRLGWQSYGVDTDATATATASQCGSILGSQIQELDSRYDQFFDVVTLSHVIEHVHAPGEALRHCWRVLRPGGYIWIETPNIDSAGYELFGRYWRGLETPRHLVLFNSRSLYLCMERSGFANVRLLPPRDVAEHLFTRSAAMRLGRIGELDAQPLPAAERQRIRQAIMTARDLVRREPERAEFLTAVAYRPGGALNAPRHASTTM